MLQIGHPSLKELLKEVGEIDPCGHYDRLVLLRCAGQLGSEQKATAFFSPNITWHAI